MSRHLVAITAAVLPATAFAHTGVGSQGTPFAAGFAHPLLGLDHVLVMVAVGLLAAMHGRAARVAYPASFVAAMVAGAALGYRGVASPAVEPTILASVIVLGAAIACAWRPPLALACAAIAALGLAHGAAHGLEGAPGWMDYVLGFTAATAALHGVGLAIGVTLRPASARILGGFTGVAGLVLALG